MTPLVGKISKYALDKFYDQYQLSLQMIPGEQCTGNFQRCHGILCKHLIAEKLLNSVKFDPTEFHDQWKLNSSSLFSESFAFKEMSNANLSPRKKELKLIETRLYDLDMDKVPVFLNQLREVRELPLSFMSNPEVLKTKRGRPKGTKKRCNQRDKSLFEYAMGNKCGNCGKAGHNSRTCKV